MFVNRNVKASVCAKCKT